MKLKTLKDINPVASTLLGRDIELQKEGMDIMKHWLKEEAIEWMLSITSSDRVEHPLPKELEEYAAARTMNVFDMEIIAIWIKHFFNLTKEDLK